MLPHVVLDRHDIDDDRALQESVFADLSDEMQGFPAIVKPVQKSLGSSIARRVKLARSEAAISCHWSKFVRCMRDTGWPLVRASGTEPSAEYNIQHMFTWKDGATLIFRH